MTFDSLNISPWIKESLKRQKLFELTKIQEQVLPYVLENKSAIITSQTGSGKTLCYLLPVLNNIDLNLKKTQAIIILPTKELSRQIYNKLLEFKKDQSLLKICLLMGSFDIQEQIRSLKANPSQIIVGTVSRINDLIKNKTINKDIKTLVLDEADMLIDLGFIKQVNEIFQSVNSDSLQKIACSATTHESLSNSLKKYLGNTKVISNSKSIWSHNTIKHHIVYTNNNDNPEETLFKFLNTINPYFCIIFANTRNIATDVFKKMVAMGYNVAMLHKDLTTRQRKNIFNNLNKNKYQYLVATDLASRGIDINGADIVISLGLPQEDIWYMHRSGRAGRNNATGDAYVIYEKGIDNIINRLQNKSINWQYLFLNKEGKLIDKPLKLRLKHKLKFDEETNQKIKYIIQTGSKKVKPGYKAKMKAQINKIKQKKRHEFIEKRIKQTLLMKNIRDSKKLKPKH